MVFVHLGAGAGDLDPGANFRDGFTEFVKKNKKKNKKIIVVEANPKNIPKLKLTWKSYKNVKIFNFAICDNQFNKKKMKLYFASEDGPHYQVMSHKKNHVLKHYPNSKKIKFIEVEVKKIRDFMKENFEDQAIDYFSIDIEGLDYMVLNNLDLEKYNIKNISFEYLHLTFFQKLKIILKLIGNNYFYNGYGIDHNNFDWTFKKGGRFLNNIVILISFFWPKRYFDLINKII